MLAGLWRHGPRFLRFGVVGASGLLVNTVVMALFTSGLGVHYLWSAVVATQASTTWNFVITDRWVFHDRPDPRRPLHRFGLFWAMNNLALPLRAVVIWALTDVAGVHYLVSNLISLVLLMLARYGFSYAFIWRRQQPVDYRAVEVA